MSKEYHRIKFLVGYKEDEDKDKLPDWRTKRFTVEHVKRYNNHSHRMKGLSDCAFKLIGYLAEGCSIHNNTVINIISEREKFISHYRKSCGGKYKDDTVKKAYSELVEHYLLIKFDKKSIYVVSPVYHHTGEEELRRKSLQELCVYAYSNNTKNHIRARKALGI